MLDTLLDTAIASLNYLQNEQVNENQSRFTNRQHRQERAIDKDDIQRLIDLEIADGHTAEYRRLAKDLFLFSYFTAGMNFDYIARLHCKDIVKGRDYSRHKTQKLRPFQLVPNALRIIGKYGKADHAQEDYILPRSP